MLTVRKIQDPQHGQLLELAIFLAADLRIQSSLAKLRLAFWVQIEVGLILLQDLKNTATFIEGIGQILWPNKIKVICGGMILGKLAVGRSHQASYRKIKTRRAELPLVITIRREGDDLV